MTTLYLPTLIRDTAHAASLPVGTVAIHYGNDGIVGSTAYKVEPDIPVCGGPWDYGSEMGNREDDEMVGWTALVPVEAEDEWSAAHYNADGTRRNRLTQMPGTEGASFGLAKHCVLTGDTLEHRLALPWTPVEEL